MIIKYCSNCEGRPCTTDLNKTTCPVCGFVLQAELAEEASLAGRAKLPETTFPQDGKRKSESFNKPDYDESQGGGPVKPLTPMEMSFPRQNEVAEHTTRNVEFVQNRTIRGRVSQYSSTGREDGEYRRLLPVKIYQAIVYRQRLEDVLHRFTVRVEHGNDAFGHQQYTDIPVNVHGTISGGLQIVDNSEVEVHGKYCNGVLMADSVRIINNGYATKVGFQRAVKAITYGILSVLMAIFICFVAASSNGDFFATLKEFCLIWLIITVVLTVLYLVFFWTRIRLMARVFSNKKKSFPIFGILLISLALAFLFISAFGSFAGFGTYLSGWIYSIVPIIIIVAALFFVIKSLFC